MATYVGFLRAINLGARRKFPKEAIVRATEGAGFDGVATHINTGNVRFETRWRSRARIESALESAYLAETGFEVPTIVFSAADLVAVRDRADELESDLEPTIGRPSRHYVSLLKNEPDAGVVSRMESMSVPEECVRVRGRAVHLLFTGEAYRDTRVTNTQVERVLGVATNRNLTVVRAVVDKWCGG